MKIFEYLELLEKEPGFRGLFRLMEELGQGTAFELHTGEGLDRISYAEYLGLIDETARRMTDLSRSAEVRQAVARKEAQLAENDPGRRGWLGLKLQNSPSFGICFWAAMAAGHPVVLIDARASRAQTDSLAAETGIIALLTEEDFEDSTPYPLIDMDQVMPDWKDPEIRHRYARDGRGGPNLPASDLPGWAGHITLCTSGTTGTSRCYVHDDLGITRQYGILEKLLPVTDRFAREGVKEKAVAFIPWHHVFGFVVCFLFPQSFGNTMVIPQRPSPESIVQACRESGVTQFVAIPAVWNGVAQLVKRNFIEMSGKTGEDFDNMIQLSLSYQEAGVDLPMPVEGILSMIRQQLVGDSLHIAVSGGGYILPETLRTINGLGYYLVNGYGMTETGIYTVVNSENVTDRLDGSVGRELYEDSLRLIPLEADPGDGGNCDRGELAIRSEVVHSGVLKKGAFQARDRQAWFHTGDIGRYCEGKLFLDGRVKDIILKADGENLYPDELEGAFATVPGLQRYVIFGLPEGLYDQTALLVEPVEGADPQSLAEAVAEINLTLPLRDRIQRFFISAKPLDLSASAKVRRGPVAEAVAAGDWPLTEYSLSARKKAVESQAPKEEEVLTTSYYTPEIAGDPAFLEVQEAVRAMVAQVLDTDLGHIQPSSYFSQDLGGDSLQSISLLTLAEVEYGLAIDERLFNSDLTVQDIAALVYRRIRGEFAQGARGRRDSACEEGPVQAIRTFEETPEFKAFDLRRQSLASAIGTFGNPYFVAQDSSLRDVSYIGDRKMLNFASYNYVGLSGDPEVNEAAIAAIHQYGTSASGSRLIAGEKRVHQDLEKALARWKGTEDALVLVGGHSTNVTFVGNFCTDRDLILYDILSHNSITEGIRMSQADARPFPHNDYRALEELLKSRRDRYEKVLIIIEGAYSMDGDVAPVPEFVRLKKEYGCFLMVDEAHSMLVLGENGRGVDEYFGLDPGEIDIHMGTLSKGFGTCGGYLAGDHKLIEYLRYNLPGFVFSVGISPPLAAAVLKGIEIMERDNSRVERLRRNIRTFLDEAHRYGMDTCLAGETAVTPILVGPDELAFMLSKQLEDEGIIAPPAVFPAVAKGQARLRFCLTSEHKEDQIKEALAKLYQLMKPYPGLLKEVEEEA